MRTPLSSYSDQELTDEVSKRRLPQPVKEAKEQSSMFAARCPAPLGPSGEAMFAEFVTTVYVLVSERRWFELNEYFSLLREILRRPRAVIIPGKPKDKEL